jgi:hypothetical protein
LEPPFWLLVYFDQGRRIPAATFVLINHQDGNVPQKRQISRASLLATTINSAKAVLTWFIA